MGQTFSGENVLTVCSYMCVSLNNVNQKSIHLIIDYSMEGVGDSCTLAMVKLV